MFISSCVLPLRVYVPTVCMSPLCLHSTVCTLHHGYVSPYGCSFMCMSLLVYVPSMCKSQRVYVPPCTHPTAGTLHRGYTPLRVHSTVCTLYIVYTPLRELYTPPCIYPLRVYIPPCICPLRMCVSLCVCLHGVYTPRCILFTMCTLHRSYVSPCVSPRCVHSLYPVYAPSCVKHSSMCILHRVYTSPCEYTPA